MHNVVVAQLEEVQASLFVKELAALILQLFSVQISTMVERDSWQHRVFRTALEVKIQMWPQATHLAQIIVHFMFRQFVCLPKKGV